MKYAPTFIKYRIFLAAIGGYIAANLCAIALTEILPTSQDEAVLIGMVSSFLFYSIAVVWVFSRSTMKSAILGLLGASLISLLIMTITAFPEFSA